MMADVETVYEALIAEWLTALSVNVLKGKPDWARPAAVLPVAALELTAWSPGARSRVGQRQPQQIAVYRGWLFARNEPELLTLMARLAAWAGAYPVLLLASERIEITLQDALRYAPETPAQQEQHALSWLTAATF
jgi:hypothetical protein